MSQAHKNKNVPRLDGVMRQAVSQITGENVTGNTNTTSSTFDRQHPSIRSARFNNLASRYANFGGVNTNVTAPNHYTPFTTPSAFQIPNNRKEVYLWAQWWFENEPKVAAGIEFYTDFPVSGFELECSNGYVKDFFEKIVKKLNFSKWLPLLSQEYHLRGDVFPMLSIDCEHCHGSNVDKDNKDCEHHGATWQSITILNPDQVDVSPHMLDREPMYFYLPPEDMVKICLEKKPKEAYDSIPAEVRKKIMSREPIKLSSESLYHMKRGAAPWAPFGTSMIRRLFPTLAYKDKLRQAQWLVAERHILPIKIVKVGTPERPASEEDIAAVQEELTAVANDPLLTLVTHDAFELSYEGATGKVLQLTNEYELIDQDIIDGMMLNKSIINGDGPSYSNAQVGLVTMAKRLEKFREELAYWIEERVFRPIAIWNGFSVEGDQGQDEYIYPTIKWDDLQLRDDTGKLNVMMQMRQNGDLSAETMIEAIGQDYDQEVERLRMEQAANFVNASGAAGAGGQGYGGMMGGMAGAPPMGGGAPPPGMDPMGGAGGGMPPMGGDMGGGAPPMGGAPGAMASNYRDNYRSAISVARNVFDEFASPYEKNIKERRANKQVKGAVHEGYLRSVRPANGRGYDLEAIPVQADDVLPLAIGPLDGGTYAYPLNAYAAWEVSARTGASLQDIADSGMDAHRVVEAKKDGGNSTGGSNPNGSQSKMQAPRGLYTRLEQKLYSLVLSAGVPYAFYAQYQAGPGMEYQLDGAFPGLRLGVEADSKTFHSSPDKILSDRRRDMRLATQGWTILRFTEEELNDHPDQVMQVVLSTIRRMMGGNSNGSNQKTL